MGSANNSVSFQRLLFSNNIYSEQVYIIYIKLIFNMQKVLQLIIIRLDNIIDIFVKLYFHQVFLF